MTASSCICAFVLALGAGTLAARPAHAQNRVANYGFGKPGTAAYEHFSFWTDDSRRTDIHYAYGKNRQDIVLHYAGRTQAGFRVRFPDGRTLYLVPSGTALRVTTKAAAPKIFAWEYEGPVNGVGTACTVCVADAAAATRLLRQHYLR